MLLLGVKISEKDLKILNKTKKLMIKMSSLDQVVSHLVLLQGSLLLELL